jgi:hypothetical protein
MHDYAETLTRFACSPVPDGSIPAAGGDLVIVRWVIGLPKKLVNPWLCTHSDGFACSPVLDGPVPAAGGDLAGLEGVPLAPNGHLVVRLERPEDLARLPVPEEQPPLRITRHHKPAHSERGRIRGSTIGCARHQRADGGAVVQSQEKGCPSLSLDIKTCAF